MLSPQAATQTALRYMQEVMPELAGKQDIRLEELESVTVETHDRAQLPVWKVTFSVADEETPRYIGQQFSPFGLKRVAKVVTLNREDGTLIAIKQYAA